MQILLTGGTGFIGKSLVKRLLQQGQTLTILSRNPKNASALFGNKVTIWSSISQWHEQTHFDAVINLAGEPIIDKAWTAKRKQALLDSRVGITEQLVLTMQNARTKPSIFLSGSAIGIYGDRGQSICNESTGIADDFAAQLCQQWEQVALKAEALGIRVVILRTGLVLAQHGGIYKKMHLPFSIGLGSQLGDGQQMMSWIHLDDYLEALFFLLKQDTCHGAFNMTAPNPVSNQQFSQELAGSLGRRVIIRTPEWALKPVLGERSILLFGGQRVIPSKLLSHGFQFRYPKLIDALKNIAVN
ncbi:MAG TPA: TIGR01777 family oxidoreductase [Arenimonas sp.]|nr:TIGR01777 family oxidoreductase [Arenimonas sp.]